MPFAAVRPFRLRSLLALALGLLAAPLAVAQQASYPAPLLKAVTPPGGRAGTTVEVTLVGDDIDETTALHFSDPGLKAERLPDPPADPKQKNPPPPPIRFKITIPANAPHGIHDVRAVGKWGISNPRAFVVGGLPEVSAKEPNSDVPDAQRIEIGTTANGTIANKTDVDYFTFAGKKGQGVVIHCAASTIDSRLSADLRLFSRDGSELAAGKFYRDGDAVISRTLPDDGDYLVRLCDFAYQGGGPESVYRLTVSAGPWIDAAYPPVVTAGKANAVTLYGRNLPGGKPAPEFPGRDALGVTVTPPGELPAFPGRLLPRVGTVSGFGHQLAGSNPVWLALADGPLVLDNESNDTLETAQAVPFPCDVCGRFEKRGDRDHYALTAKKGDVIVVEGFADRLRAPVDLYFTMRRSDTGQVLGEYDAHPDLPATVNRFFTYSDDPLARLTVPADGTYDIMVGNRNNARPGPRDVYWLNVRRERPDFHLVVVGNHESGAGLTLHRGASQAVQVVCFRQDGFDGEITLTAEALPPGVTCRPQVLGPKLKEGAVVLTVASNAADAAGAFTITGAATIDGKKVTRTASAGCLVFPAQQNQPAVSRLARSLCLAVRAPGPFRISAPDKPLAIPVGGTSTVKVKVEKQDPGFKGPVAFDLIAAPAQSNGKLINFGKVNVAPDKDGDLRVQIPSNAPPGQYSLVFRGNGKFTLDDPKTKKKRNTQYVTVSAPIAVTVFDSACDLAIGDDPFALKPGGEVTVPVKVKRLHGYAGAYTLELVPSGGTGVSAANVTIPAGANEAKLVLKAAASAKANKNMKFTVRATAKIDDSTLRTETALLVSLDAQAPAGGGTGQVKAVELLAQAAPGWRYVGTVEGDDWRKPDFDDKAWKEVKAPLGNGEPEIATRKGSEIAEKGQPVYCRRAFEVPADLLKQKGVAFRLKVASDNSAAVYLNGKAADEDSGDHEFNYWNRNVVLPAALFKEGRNVIAVRADNTAGSSDLYFDLELVAEVPLPDKK
ncbi:MAG TPA: PPC domain-containing protein [Gemmata sp.]